MDTTTIDRNTTLCLACSSSLSSRDEIFTTACCQKPICSSCIASNPRLARYNPCLACLRGVGLVEAGNHSLKVPKQPKFPISPNINGSIRDEDTFVLGDDNDSEDENFRPSSGAFSDHAAAPPYEPAMDPWKDATPPIHLPNGPPPSDPKPEQSTPRMPFKYYLNKNDTLQGIALRFKVDALHLCKLNNLPLTVIRTTPHLLHTREFIILPANVQPQPSAQLSEAEEQERQLKRVRERAQRKLQTLTKELDWRVAQAYVSLAEDPEEQMEHTSKVKEVTGTVSSLLGVGELAIARYLDDDEWERAETQAGRKPQIQSFPFMNK